MNYPHDLFGREPVPVYPVALQYGDVLDFLPFIPFPSIVQARYSYAGGSLYRILLHNFASPLFFPANQPLPLVYGRRQQELQCSRCRTEYEVVFDVAETNYAQLTCRMCQR